MLFSEAPGAFVHVGGARMSPSSSRNERIGHGAAHACAPGLHLGGCACGHPRPRVVAFGVLDSPSAPSAAGHCPCRACLSPLPSGDVRVARPENAVMAATCLPVALGARPPNHRAQGSQGMTSEPVGVLDAPPARSAARHQPCRTCLGPLPNGDVGVARPDNADRDANCAYSRSEGSIISVFFFPITANAMQRPRRHVGAQPGH